MATMLDRIGLRHAIALAAACVVVLALAQPVTAQRGPSKGERTAIRQAISRACVKLGDGIRCRGSSHVRVSTVNRRYAMGSPRTIWNARRPGAAPVAYRVGLKKSRGRWRVVWEEVNDLFPSPCAEYRRHFPNAVIKDFRLSGFPGKWGAAPPVPCWTSGSASAAGRLHPGPRSSASPPDAQDLKTTCLHAGLALPKMLDGGPWLKHPGDRKTQYYDAEARYRSMPDECRKRFDRIVWVKFQIQDPMDHKRWIDAGKYVEPRRDGDERYEAAKALEERREARGESCEKKLPGGGTRTTCYPPTKIGHEGGIGEAGFSGPPAKLHRPRFSRNDPRVYRCTPGPGITRVRALFKHQVVVSTSQRSVGTRIAVVPVRIKSYPGKGPMPRAFAGAVRGPC